MKRQRKKKGSSQFFFDGKRFHNQDANADQRSLFDIVKWLFSRQSPSWQVSPRPSRKPLRQRVGPGELAATFINHSTVLLQMDGLNLLTDPIWSDRCSPIPWLGPQRAIPPGISMQDLPPIDIVLVTHNHYDHMDLPTLRRLKRDHNPLFFVGKGNARYLQRKGITPAEELDWWEEIRPVPDLSFTFVPAQHFARRRFFDRNKTLWGGFVIEGQSGPVYFAGDTAYGPHFREIREEFGPCQLACLPIGAYLPQWIMSAVHMGPAEAVQAHLDLEAERSLPIHFGTFQLSDEAIDQPILELKESLTTKQLPHDTFLVLEPGEGRILI